MNHYSDIIPEKDKRHTQRTQTISANFMIYSYCLQEHVAIELRYETASAFKWWETCNRRAEDVKILLEPGDPPPSN